MIQEYYLHMFCGVNGQNDGYTGAGRLAVAALMAGYGLNASTKKDLQTRVGWTATPGCFLGQQEIPLTDYAVRRHDETKFALSLVPFRKVNRVMNYQLDWSVLDGEWDFRVTSPIWLNLAKIYWLGYFLFGRNVLPDYAIEKIRTRFSPECENNDLRRENLKCHYLMQFFKNLDLPVGAIRPVHLFSNSMEDLPREKVFASFALAINWYESSAGFFSLASLIPEYMRSGQLFNDMGSVFRDYVPSIVGRGTGQGIPLSQPYWSPFGMGAPSIPSSPSRLPTYCRDLIPLLFCNNERTPTEEAASGYRQVRGERINLEYIRSNRFAWITGALLWEHYLLLTGRELFPLAELSVAREGQGWTDEMLMETVTYLSPCNLKNMTSGQLIRFHLERQRQV